MSESEAADERMNAITHALSWHPQTFAAEDVAEVLRFALDPGDWAEETVVAVVRLNDGRFAAMEGACDTTGWDCRSWLDADVFNSEEDAWLNGITQDGRALIEREEQGA